MPIFAKKESGLSVQERALSDRMATLETELRRLSTEAPPNAPAPPKPAPAVTTTPDFAPPLRPAFAPMNPPTPGQFNDRGLRKFDLVAFWKTLKNHFSGSGGNNPAMVKMLAAGSIHGLRPLRRERRIARNRFIFLFLSLLAILWGLAYSYLRQR